MILRLPILCLLTAALAAADALPVPGGDFQALEPGPAPAAWVVPDYQRTALRVAADGDERFLRLAWPHVGYCYPTVRIAVHPDWARVALSLRVRVLELKGNADHEQPAFEFRYRFRDAAGKDLGGQPWPRVDRVCDWTRIEADTAVPTGAAVLELQPGFYGAAGAADIDDLGVAASWRNRPEGDPATVRLLLPEQPTPEPEPVAAATPIEVPIPPDQPAPAAEPAEVPVVALSDTRGEMVLNGLWSVMPQRGDLAASGWGRMRVPGAWNQGFEGWGSGPAWDDLKWNELGALWYERAITVPRDWAGREILLDLQRVSTDAWVFLDGQTCGRVVWPDGAVALTPHVRPGEIQRLQILVVATTDQDEIEVFFGVGEGQRTIEKAQLQSRGLIDDVVLHSRPRGAHVDSVFVKPSTRERRIAIDVELAGVERTGSARLVAEMLDEAGEVERRFEDRIELEAAAQQVRTVAWDWPDPRLWDVGQPERYRLRLSVVGAGLDDRFVQDFGFREFWLEGKTFMLNGSPLRLRPVFRGDHGGVAEQIEAQIEADLALGFNFQELWPDDSQQRGSARFQQHVARIADRKGWPISGIQVHGRAGPGWVDRWHEPGMPERFAAATARHIKRLRNHPSIVMWGTTGNFFAHEQDQNPRLIGRQNGWIRPSDFEGYGRSSAREMVRIMKRVDPTRPVFAHAGTHVADFHTANSYLGTTPLQEREEWLSSWAEDPEAGPYLVVEFGTPLDASFRRSRAFSDMPYGEPLFTEYIAAIFGPETYRRERARYRRHVAEDFNASGEDQPFWPAGKWRHSHAVRKDLQPSFDDANWQALQRLFIERTWRAWRTQGSTSLPIPWVFFRQLRLPGEDEGVLRVPFEPGRRGPYRAEIPYRDLWHVDGVEPDYNAEGEAMVAAGGPTLAHIVGASDNFHEKGHHFAAGAELVKQAALLNDSRAAQPFELRWTLHLGDAVIAEDTLGGELAVGETRFVPMRARIPRRLAADQVDGRIELVATIGEREHRDTFALRAFAPVAPALRTVHVLDPVGATSAMLERAGYAVQPWDGAAELVVVGRQALATDGVESAALDAHVRAGGRILVMAQHPEWTERALGLRVAKHLSRRLFPADADHPVLAGLDAEALRDWSGASTLVEARPDPSTANELPTYGWRWGTTGALTSGALEIPHHAGWRPILVGEFDLAYSPLLELDLGAGRAWWCAVDLEDYVGRDPAADRLLANLLDHAANATPEARRPVAYLGDDPALLDAVGLVYERRADLPAPDTIAVVDRGAALAPEALQAFVAAGGRALVLDPTAAGIATGSRVVADHIPDPGWDELAGLTVAELRFRGPLERPHLSATPGWELGAAGLLARHASGDGVAIATTYDPRALPADELIWLRYTRWRHTRVLGAILANLGASFALDGHLLAARNPADRVGLSGAWQARSFALQPGAPSPAERSEDPGLSDRARAALAADADEQPAGDWTGHQVPGAWPDFAAQDGEAVFRVVVELPESWAGQDLNLSLGPIDDHDLTWFNGEQIASGSGWNIPRSYRIPGRLVRAGRNVLAIRVFDDFGGGGFNPASPEQFHLRPAHAHTATIGYYHSDYRSDFAFGDNPYRYFRW